MNPNWSFDAFKEIIDPAEDQKVAEIKQQLWGKGPEEPLDAAQQEILKEIVISERKWEIPPEFFDLENPNFVNVISTAIAAHLDIDASWRRIRTRVSGHKSAAPAGQRNVAVINRLRRRINQYNGPVRIDGDSPVL